MTTRPAYNSFDRKQLAWLGLAVIVLYVVLPQMGNFRNSLPLLGHTQLANVWLATITTILTYVAAAGTYCLLALHRLSYARTLLVQLAAMFANRLLPAGIGNIGVNYAYLRRRKHKTAEAASVVTINNMLGMAGHMLL